MKRPALLSVWTVAIIAGFSLLPCQSFAQGSSLKGVVFDDANEDGVRDDAEFGRGGVIVDLLDAEGNFLVRQLTQPDGSYRFADLDPGVYFLRFEFSPGFGVRSQGIEVGSEETVFTPVPVIHPDSRYNFTRLNLMNPASLMGAEVSPFTP